MTDKTEDVIRKLAQLPSEPEKLPAEITAYTEEDVEAIASVMAGTDFPGTDPSRWLLDTDDFTKELFRDRARSLLDSGVAVSTGQLRRLSKAMIDHIDYPLDDYDELANRMLANVAGRILELIAEQP